MEPFIGQIMPVGFGFAPRGWALCEGQLINIASYTALFSLLGTTFGGDGETTFALPDLRGRSIVGVGSGPGLTPVSWGEKRGLETTTLSINNLPSHNHEVNLGGAVGTTAEGDGNYIAFNTSADTVFTSQSPTKKLNSGALTNTGNGQSFDNWSPFLGIYYLIAMIGVFPSRN